MPNLKAAILWVALCGSAYAVEVSELRRFSVPLGVDPLLQFPKFISLTEGSLVGYGTESAFVFDIATGEQKIAFEPPRGGLVIAAADRAVFWFRKYGEQSLRDPPDPELLPHQAGAVWVVDLGTGQQIARLTEPQPRTGIFSVGIEMNEDTILAAADRASYAFETDSLELIQVFPQGGGGAFTPMGLLDDIAIVGPRVSRGNTFGEVNAYAVQTGELLFNLDPGLPDMATYGSKIATSFDHIFVSGDDDIFVFDKTGELVKRIPTSFPSEALETVNNYLVAPVIGSDSTKWIDLYDLTTFERAERLDLQFESIATHGNLLAVGVGREVILFNVAEPTCSAILLPCLALLVVFRRKSASRSKL